MKQNSDNIGRSLIGYLELPQLTVHMRELSLICHTCLICRTRIE